MQAWFTEKDKLKYELGLRFDRTIAKKHPETKHSLPEMHGGYCPICYEEMNDQNSFALACGHTFCKECWKDYLESKVNSGNLGIDASCQQANCNMKVTHSHFIDILGSPDGPEASPPTLDTYWKWLCKNYVEQNRNVRWCPNRNCDKCCERLNHSANLVDIKCACGTEYCFKCGELAHSPVDCKDAKKWIEKESSESENTIWLKANTKNCPKCGKHIEKISGCNVMRCTQCQHEFCWLCLMPWSQHTDKRHGKCSFFNSRYSDTKISSIVMEEQKRS